MKKVTFVCLHLGKGGAERVMCILANYFSRNGYDVKMVLLYEDLVEYELSKDIQIVFLGLHKSKSIIRRVLQLTKLRSALREDECIIAFITAAIRDVVIATLGQRKRIIVSERNSPKQDAAHWYQKLIRLFSYCLADICVFQTEEAKSYYPKRVQNKGVIIPNPIRLDIPDRYEGVRSKRIVAAGRLEEQKNFQMLIRSFSKLTREFSDYDLYIYGKGSLEKQLRELAEQLGVSDKVFFPGFVQNVNELMRDAAIYVSSSNYEGISNSMNEALAMGMPAICTDCPAGGARLMIKDRENGLLIPVGDEDALYESMKTVLSDHAFAQKLADNAYKVRDEYSIEKIADQWIRLL